MDSAATANDGNESWTLPAGSFTGCRLRVSSVNSVAVGDESAGAFSVTARTPRLQSLRVIHGMPVVEFDQEPGMANQLQRAAAMSLAPAWETVAVLSNAAQTVVWPDAAAVNHPAGYYRIRAE